MITHSDEGPDRDPDDPLTVLLRPPADYLGAPPGHYEAIRRGAARRKLLRAAAGAALTVGVAALAVLPLRLSATDTHRAPTVPMAPPPVTSPAPERSASPTPSPVPSERRPSDRPSKAPRTAPSDSTVPSAVRATPSDPTPTRTASSDSAVASATRAPSNEPSAVRGGGVTHAEG
ncbi:hypothetical protein [Streptomyces sp. SID13726]|uniref:hypothetical protein n=1 Tax=Streptomyces sp. SID13726 TaxID=2706058 RepID=UPI0013BB2727|nr:hypothetical protein [Streptomyces sp. SID13726]NEB02956.1 hypothetical protein [Streptomyces sp. SID13726]